ncbi:rhamnan synthesis F family protein [Paracoccus marcusii]|uniref:rhamnan synthesis F family protein n=1 Tax=Paracoccus marcusii TaxID=59779 RepID=UPI002ED51800|nr:rhamnan synthesis F family protein [Paracoccus marcusii]
MLWRDVDDARTTVAASDNWVHRRLRLEEYRAIAPDDAGVADFAIHVHAFYIDDLDNDLRDQAAFARASRIVVTTDTEAKADRIRQMGADRGLTIQTQLVPNQGRDILPFLRLFGRDGLAGDDRIWCHLHQKKSVQTTSHGDVWRRFLHRILLGDQDMLSWAVRRIADPTWAWSRRSSRISCPGTIRGVCWRASRTAFRDRCRRTRCCSRWATCSGPKPMSPGRCWTCSERTTLAQ